MFKNAVDLSKDNYTISINMVETTIVLPGKAWGKFSRYE